MIDFGVQTFSSFLVGTQGEYLQSGDKRINVLPSEEFNNDIDEKPRGGHRPNPKQRAAKKKEGEKK